MVNVKHRHEGKTFLVAVDGARIKHKDYFHIKELYRNMHDWLAEKGYAPGDADFNEVFYHHRFLQQAGEEVRFRWYLTKDVSKFIKSELDISATVLVLKSAEVLRNGAKFKTNNGEIEFTFDARTVYDPEHKFRDHWFTRHFFDVFFTRIYGGKVLAAKYELQRDVQDMITFTRTLFKLKTSIPDTEGQNFFPNKDFE